MSEQFEKREAQGKTVPPPVSTERQHVQSGCPISLAILRWRDSRIPIVWDAPALSLEESP
jgi:hypothetical protein